MEGKTPEVWVSVEAAGGGVHEGSLEALVEAERLADATGASCCAVLLGDHVAHLAARLAGYGACRVYLIEDELLARYSRDAFATALCDLVRDWEPRLLIMAATPYGRELAPLVAVDLPAPLVTECSSLDFDAQGRLLATRPSYRDKVYVTLTSVTGPPYFATIRPGTIGLRPPRPHTRPETLSVPLRRGAIKVRTRVLERVPPDPDKVDVSEAELVIAGGRGMAGPGSWKLMDDVAAALGATVAGSRVALDAGCIPHERMVGQSGKSVAAELYVAAGISGASQHVAGIKDAKRIVAINIDRSATIFSRADLGLLGDAREVLPAILEALTTSPTSQQ